MRLTLIVFIFSILIYSCETVQPIVVNRPIQPTTLYPANGIYVDFPKDSNRMPYWYKALNDDPVNVKTVDFLSVEDLLGMKIGMTLDEIIKKTGKAPFDIIYNQADGYNVVKYHYKRIYKVVTDKQELEINNKVQPNKLEFGYDFDTSYLMFNKLGKLDMVISESNMQKGLKVIEFAKDTYKQTLNEGKLFINPNSIVQRTPIEIEVQDSIQVVKPIKKK
jgi:hypothetical protein